MFDISSSRTKEFSAAKPYTYTITRKSDGMQYHGVRYGNVNKGLTPEQDLGNSYFSSGLMREEYKKNPENFIVKIRWTFPDKNMALIWESMVNAKLIHRGSWANVSIGKGCSDTDKMNKRREISLLKKYGVKHNMHIKSSRDALKKTVMELYGVENVGQSPAIRKKVIETVKKRLGVECSFQAEVVKAKSRLTLLERFGVDNPNKSPIVRKKTRATNLKHFGCEHGFQRSDVKEKIANKRKEMYITLAKMTELEFSSYLLSISQHKAVQSQKKSQRNIGIGMLRGKIYA